MHANCICQAIGLLLCLAGLACPEPGHAAEPLKLVDASFLEIDGQLKSAKGHPNEEARLNGLKAYQGGHYAEAIEHFERAASYADKHSQHYLSLIYWHGQGVAPDRVRAYIWSDLAAERGSRKLLAIREKMWAALTAEQQQQVPMLGTDFYARYGDDIAKPRAETEIRRFARGMTGSRVGYRNQRIDITQGGPINGAFGNATPGMLAASAMVVGSTTGDRFYAEDRTKMSQYWRTQDSELDGGSGRVEVGPVTKPRAPDPS
jgi:hypothetical protein